MSDILHQVMSRKQQWLQVGKCRQGQVLRQRDCFVRGPMQGKHQEDTYITYHQAEHITTTQDKHQHA